MTNEGAKNAKIDRTSLAVMTFEVAENGDLENLNSRTQYEGFAALESSRQLASGYDSAVI